MAVANAHGTGYARFTFRVSDGAAVSAAAYTLTVDVTAVNDAATGAPTIAGTAAVRETLMASAAEIADVDGLTGVTHAWQWVRVDADGTSNPADIAGATAATYVLASADAGKRVQVRVRFTDALGGAEERISDAFPAMGTVAAVVPGAPRELVAARSDTEVALSWEAPSSDGGAAISGYRHRHATGTTVPPGTAWADVPDGADVDASAANETGVTVTNLTTGTLYAFEVLAVNSVGAGAPADPVTARPGNVSPTAADATVTATEDEAYAFRAADFAFSDTDTDDALSSVTVVTLPGSGLGAFELDGAAVMAGDAVSAADIAAGKLTFTAAADAHGDGYASFTFRVSDGIAASVSAYTMTIHVTPANDAATGKPSISGAARVGRMLTALTAGIADVEDKTMADAGEMGFAWSYQWVRVDGMTETDIANETSSTYTLADADNGKKVKVKVSFTDDGGTAEGPLTSDAYPSGATVGTNAAPTSADKTVSTNEDTAYIFKAGDFAFTDTDTDPSDALASVTVVTLPGVGALALDGTDVGAGDVVSRADIDALKLVFTPAENANGNAYASFNFKVSDGTDESASGYTMTIDVTAVNDAPTAADVTVSVAEDTAYTFGAGDFNFADVDGNTLASVTVAALPVAGTLKLDNTAVDAGDEVSKTDIDAAELVFTPAENENGTPYTTFTFRVSDGTAQSASPATMTVDVRPVNDAATGQPSISGTARVGQRLVASTAAIADVDGRTKADAGDADFAWSYQWVRVDADGTSNPVDITGATASSYVLASDDMGKKVKVKVNFTDDDGAAEGPFESAVFPASGSVEGAVVPGPPRNLAATAGDGRVRLSWTAPAAAGTSAIIRYEYRHAAGASVPDTTTWTSSGTTGHPSSPSRLVIVTGLAKSTGRAFEVRAVNGSGEGTPATATATPQEATCAAPELGDRRSVWTGTVTVGVDTTSSSQFVRAGFRSGLGSLPAASFTIRSVHAISEASVFNSIDADRGGVTIRTSRLALRFGPELGAALVSGLRLHVCDRPFDLSATIDASGGIYGWNNTNLEWTLFATRTLTLSLPANTEPTGKPSISGTVVRGETLTAVTSGIADVDGVPSGEDAFTYQWVRVDGMDETDIADATSGTYVLTGDDLGKTVKVKVSFTDELGTAEGPLASDASSPVGNNVAAAPRNLTAAAGDGRVRLSWTVPSDTGSSAITRYEYRHAAGASVPDAAAWTSAGTAENTAQQATPSQMVIVTGLVNGTGLAFEVRAVNGSGGGTSATAAATPAVATCAAPELGDRRKVWEGTLTVGYDLTIGGRFWAGLGGSITGDSLAPDRFTLREEHAIESVYVLTTRSRSGDTSFDPVLVAGSRLVLELDPDLTDGAKGAFRLHVCDRAFDLSASTLKYRWSSTGLDWTLVATRKLTLSLPPNNAPTGKPTIRSTRGVAQVGSRLVVDTDGIDDADGRTGVFDNYEWFVIDGNGDATAADTTGDSDFYAHALIPAEVGKKIQVKAIYTDLLGQEETVVSDPWPKDGTIVANTPPTAAHETVTTDEDTAYTFTEDDFNFSDVDQDSRFIGVRIVTLPATGTLRVRDAAVAEGRLVEIIQIGTDQLTFTPAENANGAAQASFTFRVNDFFDDSVDPYTMTIDVTAVNDAATGQPSISGTARVGQRLVASTAAIADVDGRTKADAGDADFAWSYQWVRVDADGTSNPTNITNATASGYVLTSDDVGKRVKVRVNFTDDDGTAEGPFASGAFPTSGSVQTNTAPAASDGTVTATEDEAYVFSEADFNFADTDSGDVLIGVTVATLPVPGTLELDDAAVSAGDVVSGADIDAGKLAFVAVANAHGTGYARFTFRVSDGAAVSAAAYTLTVDVTAVNDAATGAPTIAGTAAVREMLTASAAEIADVDGLTGVTHAWQWVRVDADGTSNPADIAGATADAYVLDGVDAGKRVRIRVRFTDALGGAEERISDAFPAMGTVAAVVPGAPRDLVAAGSDTEVALSWEAPSSDGGAAISGYRYRHATGTTVPPGTAWADVPDGADADASAANETGVTVTNLTTGTLYAFEVLAVNSVGEGAPADPATARPGNVSPTAADATVTATEDEAYAFRAADFAFSDTDTGDALSSVTVVALPGSGLGAFELDGTAVSAGDAVGAADIAAGKLTFTAAADAHGDGYASFTFRVSDGIAASVSAYTMTIHVTPANDAATGKPSISGAARVGHTLAARASDIADVDGLDDATFTWQWVRVDGMTETDIANETSSTYTLADADNGKKVKVKVSFTDDGGTAEGPLTSDAYPSGATVGTNAAPTSADKTVSTNEDTAYIFKAGDFAFTDTDTDPSDALASVTVATLPVVGEFTLDGADVGASDVVSRADIDALKLVFTPAENANGNAYASFNFKVSDGADESASGYTMTIDVTAVNDTPTAADKTVSTNEDTAYTFGAGDFNFADVDGNTLASVTVAALPVAGTLKLDNTAVDAGDEVSKTDIDAAELVFTPAENENGTPYTTFTFRVSDGTAQSASPATMTVDVRPVNDAATGQPSITGTARTGRTLKASPAGIADIDGTSKAENGEAGFAWTWQWFRVDADGTSNRTSITGARSSTYVPAAADVDKRVVVEVGFRDDDDTPEPPRASAAYPSGTVAANAVPTAADLTVSIPEDGGHTFDVAGFRFTDTDTGDALASVTVVTPPVSGELALDATAVVQNQVIAAADIAAGKLQFTPATDANGTPYTTFTFRVSDGVALSTASYTVTVNVSASNDAATGRPAISGTARVGETLTALTADIGDVDGKTKAGGGDEGFAWTYQWVRVDGANEADIADETSDTYTLAAADLGKKVKVKVSFKDDEGTAEGPLTSDAFPSGGTVGMNTAPTASDQTVTIDEDTAYPFKAADFGFSDADSGDALASVKVASLPGAGELTLDGAAVEAADAVSWADIDASKLVFTPAENANGAAYASFNFKVSDGTEESASAYTMTIDVSAVNDAPTASDKTVSTDEDTAYTFGAGDFNFADVDTGDALASVTVATLPGAGTLTLDSVDVVENQVIPAADIAAGKLQFTPAADANGTPYTTFTFRVSDGVALSTAAYTVTVNVSASNDAATGKPAVSGTARVGETLTALTADIGDVDGKKKADAGDAGFAWSYQWVRVDGANEADIADETSDTYTLAAADLGKKVKVKVSFKDDEGTAEGPLASEAYPSGATVAAAVTVPGAPQNLVATPGDARVTLTWDAPASDGGASITEYEYRWSTGSTVSASATWTAVPDGSDMGDSTADETGVTVSSLANATEYAFEVRAVNSVGDGAKAGPVNATPAVAACAGPNFGTRRDIWTGNLMVGAITSSGDTVAYGFEGTAGGLDDKTFTIGSDNNYEIDGAKVLSGGSTDGDVVFGLKDSNLTTAETAALRLHVCDTAYDFSAANLISTSHTYRWADDLDWSSLSGRTLHLSLPANHAATGKPGISGSAKVGSTLTADKGTIADADGVPAESTFTWQWVRVEGGIGADISSATSATYTLAPADLDHRVKVKASFTDDLSGTETRTSDAYPSLTVVVAESATVPVAPASFRATTGDAQVTLSWAAPASDGGANIGGYEYRHAVGTTVPASTVWTAVPDGSDAGDYTKDERSVTVTSLVNGTEYAFELRAVNSVGGGAEAGPITKTPTATPLTVTVAAGGEVDEGEDAQFTLTLSAAAPAGGLSIPYALALTNPNPISGREHVAAATLGAKSAGFAAGETTSTVTVATVDVDDLVSKNSTLTLTVTDRSDYNLGSTAQATVTIDDTTSATVTYSGGACTATVGEGDGQVALGVLLDKDVAFPVDIILSNLPASAGAGNDYVQADADGNLEFPALTRTNDFRVRIVDNDQLEGDETFSIQLSGSALDPAVTLNTGCSNNQLTVTITDDDMAELSLSAPATVTEGGAIRVTVAPPTNGTDSCIIPFAVTVTLTPSGDTGGLGSADAKSLQLSACASATADFATADDSVKTAGRSLTFTLSLPNDADPRISLPATPSAVVTVKDDDTLGVTGVAVTSSPLSGSTYGAGETISFTAIFNGKVTVTGMPQFAFSLGGATKQVAYASGSDSSALVFPYTVAAGDNDADGVSWAADALSLKGGAIKYMTSVVADQVDAALTHDAGDVQSGHKVDTPPQLTSKPSVNGTALVLTYNEALDTGSVPAAGAFTVKVGGTEVSLASSNPVEVSGIPNNTVTLTLAAAVTASATVTVSYAVPGSNPLQDAAGTDAGAFTDEAVTNGTGNAAPAFANDTASRSFTETVGDAVVTTAGNVGAVVTATDTDGDTLTYSLEGTDVAKFDIDSSSGQIRTKAGETYDREVKASYSVTVKADDGDGGTDTVAATITVDNAVEKPVAPGAPAVSTTSGSTTSLDVSWTAPGNTGRPAISGYKLRYRMGSCGAWAAHAHSGTGTTATIASLTVDTPYEVQVRAVNADGDGAWSASGSATTGTVDACATPDLTGREEVWNATLTMQRYCGIYSTLPEETYGYGFLSSVGSLSDRDFRLGTEDYRVQAAFLFDGFGADELAFLGYAPDTLLLSLDRVFSMEEQADLRLHVCGDTFNLSGSKRRDFGPAEFDYVWTSSGLDWSSVGERTLRLSRTMTGSATGAPAVSGMPSVTGPGEDGAWAAGERIEARVAFDAPVTVDDAEGTPTLGLALGGVRREAAYESGSGTAELVFALTVAEADAGAGAARAVANGLVLNGATIRDAGGADAVLAFGEAPGVVAVEIADEPGGDGAWAEGEVVTVTVVFAEPVEVSTEEGTPSVGLALPGAGAREAVYASGSGTDRLVFAYTLAQADGSVASVLVAADALALNGGAIVSTGGLDAVLTHNGAGTVAVTRAVGPALSVADATVDEGPGAVLGFAVTLDRARHAAVTVDYATGDGTAVAGEDYTAASGTLTFKAGETAKTVEVTVLDDAHAEGSETMTLTLSNASGARLGDSTATGTINNNGAMPKAWMVRFGRTVGSQVVDALTQRLEGAGASHVTVAGINVIGGPGPEPQAEDDDPFGLPEWAKNAEREADARTITADDLLLRSAFHLSSGGDATQGGGPAFTAWGRVATGGFEAEADGVTMDGDVTTGLVGFDAEWERALAGIMFSQSSGDGTYRLDAGDDAGTVESSLTGVYPYARVDLNAKVSAWALAGVGSGELTLHQEVGKPMPTDISMRMGALGVKGQVLDGTGASGLVMNVKSDAMWVGTKSGRTNGMVATEGDVTRVRLIVEGERSFETASGATLTPSAEVGLRHDGGDAETGTGVEVGAGLRYIAGPLTIEGQVRALVAHGASGYEEWGMSGAIRVTPSPSGRGLTLAIAPAWGRTESAAGRLWSAQDARGLGADNEFEADSRLEMEAGYGFGLPGSRGVLTPYAGMTLGDAGARAVRTGTRWQLGPDAVFGLETTRQTRDAAEAGARTVRSDARWQLGPDSVVGLEATRHTSDAAEADNQLMLRVALRF